MNRDFMKIVFYPFKFTNLFKTNNDWELISDCIPEKTVEDCKFKWLGLQKINLKIFPWSIEEDQKLKNLILDDSMYQIY